MLFLEVEPRATVSQLHFTEAAVSVRADEAGQAVRDASVSGMFPGLVGGIPFILGDDGAYDVQLNRFFRECPSMGVRSVNSVRAYAHDLLTWIRFLAERRGGKSVWHADRQDIIAFHRARRLTDGPGQIAGSSWNRSVTALEKFYGWAWEEELIVSTPFARGSAVAPSAPWHTQRRSRSFREPAARRHDMRFIGMDRFILFRDVGLRAHLLDGAVDPAWRGQNGERDALFAEFLTATGLRLEEASSLLPSDLPRHDDPLLGDVRSCPVTLAPAICKGGKGREIRIPRRLLRRIDDYMNIERPNAVARWRARRGWQRMRDPIRVLEMHHRSVTIDGGGGRSTRRRLDVIRPRERARLVLVGTDGVPAEPAALWLADNGAPMRPAAWEAAFLRGDARCRARGLDLHVTPHMLRHTFAVHMLSLLIQTQIGSVFDRGEHHGAAYRRVIGDPLQKLQRLLGHSSITSTYIYLDSLEESRALVDAAATRWADDLEAVAP
jgi:site-specific recombinase XerD